MEITKETIKKLSRSNLLLNADGSRPTEQKKVAALQQMKELLDEAYFCYKASAYQRNEEYRCNRYYKGYHMEDKIPNPDGGADISEGDYIRSQGNVPIVLNMIPRIVQPIVGEFCGRQLEPFILARDTQRKVIGRKCTALMKQTYESDCIQQTDNDGIEKSAIAGLVIFHVGYEMDDARQRPCLRVRLEDNRTMFYDDPSGKYFENLHLVGKLHDMDIMDVHRNYAHSKDDIARINAIYSQCKEYTYITRHFDPNEQQADKNFFIPKSPRKCRVIEVWHKEGYFSYMCHDVQKGDFYTIRMEDRPAIDAENAARMLEWTSNGGDPEQCPLILCTNKDGEDEPIYNTVWVCRFLTPDGYVLEEKESPYEHGEHPWVMGARMFGGEISSITALAIPSNRMIDRLATRIESQRTSSTKGLTVFDDDVLKASGVSLATAASVASKPNGVLSLKHIEGHEPLRQYRADSSNAGDVQMLQMYMNVMADQTGIQGPYRGAEAKSGTPASLFLQETQNASNNIAPLIKWYEGLIIKRNWKILKVLLQYTDPQTVLRVVGDGGEFINVPLNTDEIRNVELDMYMTQSSENGPMYISNEDKLYNMAIQGLISPRVYVMNSKADFAEKLLETMDAEQQGMMQQQQQMQQAAVEQQV